MAVAIHGRSGSVTWTTLTHLDTRVNSWTLDYSTDAGETTAFGVSAPWGRTYLPGLTTWGGSYEGRCDDTDYPQPSDIGHMNLISLFVGTGGTYYKGSAFITSWSPSVPVDGIGTYTVSFQGSGNITISDA